MSRAEYWHDAHAPGPYSLVPACGVLAVDDQWRVLLQRRRDTGQWALPIARLLWPTAGACRQRGRSSGPDPAPGVLHRAACSMIQTPAGDGRMICGTRGA